MSKKIDIRGIIKDALKYDVEKIIIGHSNGKGKCYFNEIHIYNNCYLVVDELNNVLYNRKLPNLLGNVLDFPASYHNDFFESLYGDGFKYISIEYIKLGKTISSYEFTLEAK